MWEAVYDSEIRQWILVNPHQFANRRFETLHECFQYVSAWEQLKDEREFGTGASSVTRRPESR
jgi:hypothetical protein